MTTIYIHIGLPKTGTSFLQFFLFENRDTLLKQGWLYPLSGILPNAPVPAMSYNHIKFRNAIRNPEKITPFWEDFYQEINSILPAKVLISEETLANLIDYSKICLIREYLSKYSIKIILYLRRQDDYFFSLYCEAIQRGRSWQSFKDWVQGQKKNRKLLQLT